MDNMALPRNRNLLLALGVIAGLVVLLFPRRGLETHCVSERELCRPPPNPVLGGNSTAANPIPGWIPPGWRFSKRMHPALVGSIRLYTPQNSTFPGTYGRASSTTVIRDPKLGGFWAITRHVCYHLHDDVYPYYIMENKGKLWSRATLTHVGQDLKLHPAVPVRELRLPSHLVTRRPNETLFEGLEDLRIVSSHKGLLYVTAVHHQMVPGRFMDTAKCRIALLTVDPATGTILDGRSFGSPASPWREKEKNWLPFAQRRKDVPTVEDLLAIYEFHPLTIINLTAVIEDVAGKPNFDGVPPPFVSFLDTPIWFRMLRGSAGPVRWKAHHSAEEELLLIVHELEFNTQLVPFYTHRFLTLDPKSLALRRLSPRFLLHGRRIEYIIGLELDSSTCCGCLRRDETNALVLGYSIMDNEAWVARICSSTVDNVLKTRAQDHDLWVGGD